MSVFRLSQGALTLGSFLDILGKSFSSRPMTTLMQKRRYRVVLDLEILDDSHPEDFNWENMIDIGPGEYVNCLLYTSPSPRDKRQSRMPSSA